MGISASLEPKTANNLSLETKYTDQTWDDMNVSWEDANGTWENPLQPGTLETKSFGNLSLESRLTSYTVTAYPQTVVNTDGGLGADSGPWVNPENISADDGNYATASLGLGINNYTDYLDATNFSFSIPSGATINYIKVYIERHAATSDILYDYLLKLIVAGSVVGNNKWNGDNWPTSDAEQSYEYTPSQWGVSSITADQINSSDFGIRFQVYNSASGNDPFVDYIKITINYTY